MNNNSIEKIKWNHKTYTIKSREERKRGKKKQQTNKKPA